jgi:hypothetical protein
MKRNILVVFLILFSISSFAQSKNEISVLYGKSIGSAKYSALRSGNILGISPAYLRENNTIGISFSRYIGSEQRLKIETGIKYLAGNTEDEPSPSDYYFPNVPQKSRIKLISTPIYLKHYFGKYFFINEGVMFDYQRTDSDLFTGMGIGFGFGIGAEFNHNNFTFFLNPKYERHLFLSDKFGLVELGIMFGAGYKF